MKRCSLRLPMGLALGVALMACNSTPERRPNKPVEEEAPAAATPAAATTTTTPTTPPTTPTPTATATATSTPTPGPKAGDRTGDGIDDENWLPRKDTAAYGEFQQALELARRDPAAAVSRFVDAANRSTGFYAAWFNAGAAAEAAGDAATAERHYRQALNVRPDYGPALLNLSALLTRGGRDGDAQKLVDEAVRKFPEKAGPHLAAASRSLTTRDLTKAEEEARLSMRFDERNVAAMLMMARVFRAQGRTDTARFAIDNALALEPGNALLHLERANVLLMQQGEAKEALFAFERAARLRPSLAEAQEGYGLLLLDQGFSAEAQRAFEQLVRLDPKNPRSQLHLGNALRAVKQYGPAEAAYRKALELDKTLDEARFNLGVLFVDNSISGTDDLARWKNGLAELKEYKSHARPDAATARRLDDYIDSTEKRIAKEQKRREREEKRKTEDAKKPPEPPPAAAPAPAPAAAAPAATPPAPKKPEAKKDPQKAPEPADSTAGPDAKPVEGGVDDK